jgi:heme-degrading monooxygenase HmoA
MWEDAADPTAVHAVIWWESLEHWHAIPQADLAEVMEAMGEHERDARLSTFKMIRDC